MVSPEDNLKTCLSTLHSFQYVNNNGDKAENINGVTEYMMDSNDSADGLRAFRENNNLSVTDVSDNVDENSHDQGGNNAFETSDDLDSVSDEDMHIMYDNTDLAPDYRLLSALFLQLKPTQVVTCPSLSDPFLRKVHSLVTGEPVPITPSADPPSFSNKLHFIPSKEFRYSSCKRIILELRLPSEPENASDSDRHNYIMSVINLNAPGLVSCVGGLLYYLQRSQARLALCVMDCPILAIHTLSLKDLVWVDEETIHALQVFAPQAHPSSYKWFSGASKEGLSVYALLNRCHSSAGSKHMRMLLAQPIRDIDVLRTRHEVISFCLKPVNEPVVKSITDSIVHVKSVMKLLKRMTNAQASVAQWKAFYNTIYNAVLVAEVCAANAKDVKYFEKIGDCLCDSIFVMSHCINRTMDFEQSALQKRVIIKSGICEELDQLKERYTQMSQVMGQVAEHELQQLPQFIESCSMAYIPEFKSKDLIHYKSARCLELDNLLGDVHLNVIELESKIVLKLVQFIQRNISPLIQLTALIAELDCLLAFTQAARDYNLVQPTVTAEKQIHIVKGRHLLHELCVDMFVPNDAQSSEEHGLIHILSGPNASGKSVYLKQVVLIIYLAHVGSFVPAEKAEIGVLDQIHTRIQTVESVSNHLSAFMIDLRQMSSALRNASKNSLVIIDEFGKGTSEVDGLGILAACLKHFIEQTDSPHVFVSTHFHSLPKLLPASSLVKLWHLEHMVERGELVFLFRLKEGAVESSFALQVAQAHGLTKSAADRATQVLNGLRDAGIHLTADGSNKQVQLATKRRQFLRNFSSRQLDETQIKDLQKELISLQV